LLLNLRRPPIVTSLCSTTVDRLLVFIDFAALHSWRFGVSADDLFTEYGRMQRRGGDPYATRPLQIAETIDRPVDLTHPTPVSLPRVARRRPPNRSGSILLNAVLILLIVLLLVAGGGLYYLDRSYQGKIYPNVTVQGLPVGEMTPDAAEVALRGLYTDFLRQPITLTFGDRVWRPSPAEVGIEFDFKGAIDQAYHAGRGNGMVENLQEVAAIWQNGLELPLRVTFDQGAMQRYVAGLRAELESAPVDAQLLLNGTSVTTTPSHTGRQVLVDETVADLTASLRSFKPGTVGLRTRDLTPRLLDADVASARTQIEAMLQGSLTLQVERKEYVWTPEEIALMTRIARVPHDAASDRIDVFLDQYQVDRRMRKIADETGRGSVNPRLAWNNGDLQILKPGKPGLRLDEAKARELIIASIAEPNRTLVLPVREVDPQVTEANMHDIGIKELVSVGKSDFTGSAAYRIHNVGMGMQILNGILLAPGEEFSFNQNIGSIDERNGFVQGYAIIQNRTQLEFGGGICQDSTTMFRAAFWAGLPITERWGHSFYISWYDKYGLGPNGNGQGMDATIFTGGPDLKFVNDTGNWLLIQSWSNPKTGVAQVEFYGTKPNRQVLLSQRVYDRLPQVWEPVYVADPKQPRGAIKQTDTARGGMTIDVYRTVIENGVRSKPELFRTKFKAWPNIYAVNPADIGPDGKPLIQPQTEQPQATPAPGDATPAPAQPQPAPEQPQPTPAPQG
jgi:vancomycin resistance protein YoaR